MLKLKINNSGESDWMPSGQKLGSVNVGVIQYNACGQQISDVRLPISEDVVQTGSSRVLDVLIDLHSDFHEGIIDLVAEHVVWFEQLGGSTVRLQKDSSTGSVTIVQA